MNLSGGQVGDAGAAPIRPSRLWYWIAGCLLAGAAICVALAVAGFFALNRQIHDFQRVRVPGHGEVTFAQPGGYVLYLERPGQCCSGAVGTGNSVPFPSWSMTGVVLVPVAGGAQASISKWGSSTESYSVSGHQGQAALSLTITRAGRYLLGAASVSPRSVTDIAVGRGIGHALLVPLLLILVAIFAFLPAGLLVGGVTAYRRRRARRPPPQFTWPAQTPWPAMGAAGPGAAYPGPPGPYPPGYGAIAPSYLLGGPVGFGAAIKQAFVNAFDYRGRASRSAYWWFALFEVIVSVALDLLIFIPLSLKSGSLFVLVPVLAISGIVAVCLGLTALSLLVRRLHDSDKSGWWILIVLVPFAGPIVLLVFTLLEGTPGPNRYQP